MLSLGHLSSRWLDPRRFLRACMVLAALWLLVGIPLMAHFRPLRAKDFPQFYMGGVIARHAAWDALYPEPNPASPYNPGLKGDSFMPPRYAELAREYGVETGDEPRFIQPPPNALLLLLLSFVPYPWAYLLWTVLMGACTLFVAAAAGRACELCHGRATLLSGLAVLLVASSHLAYSAIRSTNIDPLVAALIASAVLGLLPRARATRVHAALAAASLWLGATIKFAPLVLLPLACAMRRWTVVAWAALLGITSLLLSLAVMGPGPWVTYATRIFPLMSRPSDNSMNQSVHGLLIYYTHRFPLPDALADSLQLLAALLFAALSVFLFTRPRRTWRSPPAILAAAALLLCWLLIFSPLSWDKYHTWLFPFWGWLLWEAGRSRLRAALVATLIVFEWGLPRLVELPEPLVFHMLFSLIAIATLALHRLASPAPAPAPVPEARPRPQLEG